MNRPKLSGMNRRAACPRGLGLAGGLLLATSWLAGIQPALADGV